MLYRQNWKNILRKISSAELNNKLPARQKRYRMALRSIGAAEFGKKPVSSA
jgi:hypothetical protein